MSTIVEILTKKNISKTNIAYECFKEIQFLSFQHFSFYEQLKFHAQLS